MGPPARDVSIEPVNNAMELCFQVYRMVASGYFEIGHVGTAFDLDVFEHTLESPGGG
jgi:hypothetical protein